MRVILLCLFAAIAHTATGVERLHPLPRFHQSIPVASISIYDRTSCNNDGFSGRYSYLRQEGGRLLIADLWGPGVIRSIWTPAATGDSTEFEFAGEPEPRIRLPLRQLFTGRSEPFFPALSGLAAGQIVDLVSISFKAAGESETVDIGSRRELFLDRHLIDELRGDATLQLHQPKPQEVVLATDNPWEGNTSAYYTIFQDGDLFRMYYRGSHYNEETGKPAHREVTCYAESTDGVYWTKPNLGLVEFDGSSNNNIVWDGIGAHNFTPFLDTNPDCPAKSRYKALGRGLGEQNKSLFAFESSDGIQWKQIGDEPVIREGAFDSQNLAFWDPARNRYLEFHRQFRNGLREIMTTTSTDFVHWEEPSFLNFPDAPREHLYTNAIMPYPRAPHILIGFPTRFHPERGDQVEPLFMSSRDGRTFHRWPDPVIPTTAPSGRDGNRSNYMAWGLLQLPEDDTHLSVYGTEAYYTGPDSRLRRFTYRTDGFVSAHSDSAGGLLTKLFCFTGAQLSVNVAVVGEGSLRVELQDATGAAIEGFALADCPPIRTDSIDHLVQWKQNPPLARLAGQPVRILFELSGADLYSFQFTP